MTIKNQRFLVTGCAGFIGGHMVDRLVALGCDVVGLDDFSTGSRDNIAASWGKFTFIEGSVCDSACVASAVAEVDRIIHLASVPSVPRSVADPVESANASIVGTVTLLDAARRAGVKRVVQAASSSAYGDSEVLPRVESLLPSPMSPYAVAKLAQEYYAAAFFKCYGIDTVSLRYFNVFGPRQSPDSMYAAVIPKFIARMRRGEAPEIYGDGGQTRDFTYIDNVIDANYMAAVCPSPLCGEVANIGAGGGYSLNDLVDRLNRILGTALTPVYLEPRAGDVRDSMADVSKARRLFGYEPGVTFEEGLERTVRYFESLPGTGPAR